MPFGFVAQPETILISTDITVGTREDKEILELVVNQVAYADLLVRASTDDNAASILEVYVVKKTNTLTANTKYQVLGVPASEEQILCFHLEAGTYLLKAFNYSYSYDAKVSEVVLKPYVWQYF